MTKKEQTIRTKAYEAYKDNDKFYIKQGPVNVFDIEKAVAKYMSDKKNKTKKTINDNVSDKTSATYTYDITRLFSKGFDVIDYDALEDEWLHRNKIARFYENSGKYTALFLKLWFNTYIEKNNISINEGKINYNERHYALRNDKVLPNTGEIYRTIDFIKFTANGLYKYKRTGGDNTVENRTRTGSDYKTIGNLILTYFYFFKQIGIEDKDLLFIHILYMLFKTVDIDTWIYETSYDMREHNYFSPMTLKNFIDRYNDYGNAKQYIFKDTKKHRFQKLFLEPGYEKEAKQNYLEDKHNFYVDTVKLVINDFNNKKLEVNNLNIYNEVLRYCKITYRNFMSIVKKNNLNIGNKIKFEIIEKTETIKTEDFRGNKISYDIKAVSINKAERKQQERSKWHKLVEEGFSYEKVIEHFPNVSKGAYKKYKTRFNNTK